MTVKKQQQRVADTIRIMCNEFLENKLQWKDLLTVLDHWLPEMQRMKTDAQYYDTATPLTQAQMHSRHAFERGGAVLNVSKPEKGGSYSFMAGDQQMVIEMLIAAMGEDSVMRRNFFDAVFTLIEKELAHYGQEALQELENLRYRYKDAFR